MAVLLNTPQTPPFARIKHFPLASFMRQPAGVYFATQESDEVILLFLRKHPITQIGWILVTLILILIPFFLFPFINATFPALASLPSIYAILTPLAWYLLTFAFMYIKFILWYYNINIVTNKRVIDMDFPYLLVQEQTETDISHVQDVTEKRIGAFSTIFDYGDVFVQTAGTEVNIEFLRVPHPRDVVKTILDLMGS